MPLLNTQELRWKKCFLRPLSVIPAVLWNTGFSVPSWNFHNIFGMLQSLVSLFINYQIVIASLGLRLKRKIELQTKEYVCASRRPIGVLPGSFSGWV